MQSQAKTIKQYLSELETKRSKEISQLVNLVRESIKPGFDETMRWGMISYEIPMELSGPTYNNQPLSYIGIASQKNHISVYLMGLYAVPEVLKQFQTRWAKAGHKLDMGKGCVRFASLADADLPTLRWAIKRYSARQFLAIVPPSSSASKQKKD